MATFTGYRLDIPEARLLASLHSIRHDLEGTLEYCQRLEELRSSNFDSVLWEALSSAAVVRYARCFGSGSREQLAHGLFDAASEEHRQAHSFFIALRSKHVAHSVNDFEENNVTVTIREDTDHVSIQGIGAHHDRVLGLDFDGSRRLSELATWVLTIVNLQVRNEEAKLLPIALSLGPEKVRSFGLAGRDKFKPHVTRTRSKP